MKKLLLIITTFFVLQSLNAQTADSIYNKIHKLDFKFFDNKPVGQFIDSLPVGYSKIGFLGHFATNAVRLLYIEYPGGSNLHIYVKEFHYLNPVDPNWNWDLNLFKKEKLFYVILLHPDYSEKSN
jgi:hypothetical protein